MSKKDFVPAKINVQLTPAEMLKELRALQGLSQAELAKLSGMTQSNISALDKVHPAVILFPDFDIQYVA